MNINTNNKTFIHYLNEITKNVLLKFNIKDYFMLNDDEKLTILYGIFTFLKNSHNTININFKALIILLRKKNEVEENYEFAAILNDIIKMFDKLSDIFISKKNEIKNKKAIVNKP